MKSYEYVSIESEKIFGYKIDAHRDIINAYAVKGYRYVGFIPTKEDIYGRMLSLDLIFEIDQE